MTIASVEAIPVEVGVKPLEEPHGIAPYISSYGSTTRRERVLIRIETEGGVVGWGETRPTLSIEATKAVLEHDIRDRAVGRELWEIEAFTHDFSHEYLNIDSFIGGVEIAMWDALGKQLGTPVHELIGGKCRDTVEFAYCLGILDPSESREHARRALDQGYSVLKTKAGRDWKQDIKRVKSMHDEVDGELEFRLDPNQAWSTDQAIRVGAALEDHGIYLQYLEQPLRIDSYGSYKRLRNRLRTPIAVNEDMYHPRNLFYLGKEDAIDAAVVDVIPAGGILALKRLVGIATDLGISVSHHNAFDLGIKTAAVLHAVSSTPEINLPPDTIYYAWEDDLLTQPFEITEATMQVPDGPGLGVSVDESKLEEYRID